MSHNDCLTLFSWKVWISLLIKKVHLVWVIFFSCITHGMHAHTFKNLLLSLPSFCFSRAPSRDSLTRVCSLSRLAISRKTGKTETAMQLSKYSLKDHRFIMFAAYPDHTDQLHVQYLINLQIGWVHLKEFFNFCSPAIFASSLLTWSPFFANKWRISSFDDRELTCNNKKNIHFHTVPAPPNGHHHKESKKLW